MSVHARRIDAIIPGIVYDDAPRNVYWEMTQACDLSCRHCRADAQPQVHPDELTTAQGEALIDSVKELGSILILTGGDPMKRSDLFDLMDYARAAHVPVAITPSTTPTLTEQVVERFGRSGISAMGVSLDGPDAEIHDTFRNVGGTFLRSQQALRWAREYSIPVQVNTTVTTFTLPHIAEIFRLLCEEHTPTVRRWSLFQLIPVGRGAELGMPTAEEIDDLFAWVYERAKAAPFHIATVEAPHYRRYWIQRRIEEGAALTEIGKMAGRMGFGVRDGNGVIFVSHRGDVFPAGFLPFPNLGNVKETPLHRIYRDAPALRQLRDADALHGRCGRCEFRYACGGSRARAYAVYGDVLAEDPLCRYEPGSFAGSPRADDATT
jgi:radical SAM protein